MQGIKGRVINGRIVVDEPTALPEGAGAIELLMRAPDAGRRYRALRLPGLRRLLLPATRYHVYYVHGANWRECIVLAVWSAVRGRAPHL